jgi:hypothetical protein
VRVTLIEDGGCNLYGSNLRRGIGQSLIEQSRGGPGGGVIFIGEILGRGCNLTTEAISGVGCNLYKIDLRG